RLRARHACLLLPCAAGPRASAADGPALLGVLLRRVAGRLDALLGGVDRDVLRLGGDAAGLVHQALAPLAEQVILAAGVRQQHAEADAREERQRSERHRVLLVGALRALHRVLGAVSALLRVG